MSNPIDSDVFWADVSVGTPSHFDTTIIPEIILELLVGIFLRLFFSNAIAPKNIPFLAC